MKKLSITVLLLLAIGACKKDNSVISNNITADDAAEIASSALATSNNGFASVALDVSAQAQIMYDLKLSCGATKTASVTHQSPANAAITYSYTFGYNYTANCNTNNIVDNITGTATATGSFDGPRLSAAHTGNATFRVSGLISASSVYVVDASYDRSGKFASKTGGRVSGTTAVNLTISNYSFNKMTKAITSGSGTISISGATDKGATFTFNATVTFTNDGNATVMINSSATYIVNLTTGAWTKK